MPNYYGQYETIDDFDEGNTSWTTCVSRRQRLFNVIYLSGLSIVILWGFGITFSLPAANTSADSDKQLLEYATSTDNATLTDGQQATLSDYANYNSETTISWCSGDHENKEVKITENSLKYGYTIDDDSCVTAPQDNDYNLVAFMNSTDYEDFNYTMTFYWYEKTTTYFQWRSSPYTDSCTATSGKYYKCLVGYYAYIKYSKMYLFETTGKSWTRKGTVSLDLSTETWYKFEVFVSGSSHTASVYEAGSDSAEGTYTFSDSTYDSGWVGFGCAECDYDDIGYGTATVDGTAAVDPSFNPTNSPSLNPTVDPSSKPTNPPSSKPTVDPSSKPTKAPSPNPTTHKPTHRPTEVPTQSPTYAPGMFCTLSSETEISHGGFTWDESYMGYDCLLKSDENKNNIILIDANVSNITLGVTFMQSSNTTYQVSAIMLRSSDDGGYDQSSWCMGEERFVCVAQVKKYSYVKLEFLECESDDETEFDETDLVDFNQDEWYMQKMTASGDLLTCELYDSSGDLVQSITANSTIYGSKLNELTDVAFGAFGKHYYFRDYTVEYLST